MRQSSSRCNVDLEVAVYYCCNLLLQGDCGILCTINKDNDDFEQRRLHSLFNSIYFSSSYLLLCYKRAMEAERKDAEVQIDETP